MSLPNVAYDPPPHPPQNWVTEAHLWSKLNQEVGGNPQFKPLTVKAAYVIGTMHGLCRAVSILLQNSRRDPVPYMAAYGMFAASVELLGRCLNGNATTRNSDKDLKTGLSCLDSPAKYDQLTNTHLVLKTFTKGYTINELAQLRHFAAHGQATVNMAMNVDFALLDQMPTKIGNALGWYWSSLQQHTPAGEHLCTKLAAANIKQFREFPILETWKEFADQSSGSYRPVSAIFGKFNWSV